MKKRLTSFDKRTVAVFLCVCLIFSCLSGRIAWIENSLYSEAAGMQFNRNKALGETRGYIYDRNMEPLVNSLKREITVFTPCIQNKNAVKMFYGDKCPRGKILEGLTANNLPETDYLKKYNEIRRYSNHNLCTHIIGYTDSDNRGVCGIEKAFDRLLTGYGGTLSVQYEADGRGNILPGEGLELIDNNYDCPGGISLTIDKNIQEITERIMKDSEIRCGAAVVMDCRSFELAAAVSLPDFDILDMEKSINDKNMPFINRAFSAYAVGSVFKPVIAASAIENGWDFNEKYICTGNYNISGENFRCYNRKAHGTENLSEATENSCNTFFINLGLKTGAENIVETAALMGFGKEIKFCSEIISDKGVLPDTESVNTDSLLALLSFGQGNLTAAPVQIAAAYSVFADNGIYKEPYLLNNLIDGNGEIYGYYKSECSYRALNADTCEIINKCLYNNMLKGTGKAGMPENFTAAGKTATAQTGITGKDGNEKLYTWFAGFFPYENPLYTVVIFDENGHSSSKVCAPVFKKIAEEIIDYRTGSLQ